MKDNRARFCHFLLAFHKYLNKGHIKKYVTTPNRLAAVACEICQTIWVNISVSHFNGMKIGNKISFLLFRYQQLAYCLLWIVFSVI